MKYHDDDVLNFEDVIVKEQFYDAGRANMAKSAMQGTAAPANKNHKIPDLMMLRAKMDLLPNERETLLVDMANDQPLRDFQVRIQTHAPPHAPTRTNFLTHVGTSS